MCYFSRLYQLVKLFLFAPSSSVYTCPLAMTDGAAKTIEVSLCLHVIGLCYASFIHSGETANVYKLIV